MSSELIEQLMFKVDQLGFKLHENELEHRKCIDSFGEEAQKLSKRIVALRERSVQREHEKAAMPADDTSMRRVEWRIDNCSELFRDKSTNDAIMSPEFSILGFKNLQLEFFPRGRDSTVFPGFCSLFLWCGAGMHVKYQLFVGGCVVAPDEDAYVERMGHGHSNFCSLAGQIDPKTDSVTVGLEVLNISGHKVQPGGIKLYTTALEGLISKEADILWNRDMDRVEWKIKNIWKRIREVPQGNSICSPLFSAAGVSRQMLMEFYPNGIKQSKEGYCGFYLRCPNGTSLIITLFVGGSQKGPIQADFDGNSAKGQPDFCRLQDQLSKDQDDLIIGFNLRNPSLEKEITNLEISSDDPEWGGALAHLPNGAPPSAAERGYGERNATQPTAAQSTAASDPLSQSPGLA